MSHGFKPQRADYITPGAIKVTDKKSDAIAYTSQTVKASGAIVYCATGFIAKQQRPHAELFHTFATEKARNAAVAQFFVSRYLSIQARAAVKQLRTKPRSLQVGQVLTGSWGYDETHVDAWQVIGLVGKISVKIQRIALSELATTGPTSANVVPMPDHFIEPPEIATRRVNGNTVCSDRCALSPWSGRPLYESR